MTVFDVYLNGRKVCRAGVGDDGVLNAIITWVKLTGPAARTARKMKQPLEEMRLQVGGLARDTHRRWPGRNLKPGDSVTVKLVSADGFDPPAREKPRDPKMVEREQKRYYLKLKKKYERPRGTATKAGGAGRRTKR